MREISRGAEAVIFDDGDLIVKERVKKNYRLDKLDMFLRTSRTKKEVKILDRLKKDNLPVPKVFFHDDCTIKMEKILGKQLKEIINKENYVSYTVMIADFISKIHDLDIIHGDLTTSNMILEEKSGKLYFIDFGLSIISKKVEDKAVDIHLLKQAIESRHHEFYEEMFNLFIKKYSPKDKKEILSRLDKVEGRGRNKNKN